jgi:predicted metal-dependent hydrolase
MDASTETYEPRYLAGIVLFNRHDFFEAHEVWESLWQDCCGPERRFYQGLIQAAVALLHFGNGNLRGAIKLYRSARDYMERFDSPYLGLDSKAFWEQMERCFAPMLAEGLESKSELDSGLIPEIRLDPPPASWPDPAEFEERAD